MGRPGREAEITSGATRGWAELVADVETSTEQLERAFAATPDEVWATGQGRLLAGIEPVREFPHRRAREVEIHRLDLGLGATYDEWTDGFVAREWPLSVARLAARLPDGESVRLVVEGADGTDDGGGRQRIGPVRAPRLARRAARLDRGSPRRARRAHARLVAVTHS